MGLSNEKKQHIKEILKHSLRQKFENYKPETKHMPFHYRLLGKDRMALFSFIQSINTTFGTSIYEPVAIELATGRYKRAASQVKPYAWISSDAQTTIQEIMDELLSAEREPDRNAELKRLRAVCQTGAMKKIKPRLIDIWLEDNEKRLFLIDIKTVKPNIGSFIEYKRKMLEWVARELASDSSLDVYAIIGIPFNPYEPKPYRRWTIRGMLDIKYELLVAEELWNFIGGEGAYSDILDCFEEVGIELRPEIDEYFKTFK